MDGKGDCCQECLGPQCIGVIFQWVLSLSRMHTFRTQRGERREEHCHQDEKSLSEERPVIQLLKDVLDQGGVGGGVPGVLCLFVCLFEQCEMNQRSKTRRIIKEAAEIVVKGLSVNFKKISQPIMKNASVLEVII